MDWTIVAGAAGAVLGSALTLGGVWLAARQRERADLRADAREQRAEWGRRLDIALGELAEGADPDRRFAGRAILESLIADDRAPEADRALAEKLLVGNRGPSTDAELGSDMDGPSEAGHNEDNAGGVR